MVEPCGRQVRRRGGRLPGTFAARTQACAGGPHAAGGQKGHDMTEVSRRQLLAGAAGLAAAGGLAACGSGSSPSAGTSSASAAGKPKRGGNFRLGVTGGGSKDIMDGQNIITKPDQARLMTRLRDAAALRRELPAHHQRPGRERHPGQPEAVHDQAAPGHRVPERQDVDGRRRHLLVPAHRDQGQRPHRVRRHGHHGHREHEEAGQVHGPAPAEDPGLDGPADPGQLHVRHRARRVQGVPGTRRSAPAPTSSSRSRPASRASTSATRTTGAAASRTSTR